MQKILFLSLFTLLAMPHKSFAQSEQFLADFRQKWGNAFEYTFEVAELMPEDAYSYKPTPEQKTFREQLLHILQNAVWLCSSYLGGSPFEKNLEPADQSKAELLVLIQETFAYTNAVLEKVSPEMLEEEVSFFTDKVQRKGQILTLLNDHHTHHRGQLLIYLRLNDIKPPKYRGW
ncbi:MAG: DinB family protein [Phaeodactylibacter sp.]|nr:DinB family protein [Phaeodactylibacter sp.]